MERKKSKVEHPPTLLGGTAIKPVERHGFEAIRYFIHNPETGQIFTRTPKSWFLITLFYCIYYSCLAAFWYGMLTLFLSFVPENTPRYMLGESIIGTNPGVGVRPIQPVELLDSSIFRLVFDDADQKPSAKPLEGKKNADWAQRLQNFLDTYKIADADKEKYTDCSQGPPKQPDNPEEKPKACEFKIADALGPCNAFPYGYTLEGGSTQVEPCIILKVNKIYGWVPKPFKKEHMEEAKKLGAPQEVLDLIEKDEDKIYVHCEGENPADNDVILDAQNKSRISYFPTDQSFDLNFFPFVQVDDYQSPLVAIKFGSWVPKGQLLHIQCKLWHREATHYLRDRIGLAHFELLLEMDEERRKKQKEAQAEQEYNVD